MRHQSISGFHCAFSLHSYLWWHGCQLIYRALLSCTAFNSWYSSELSSDTSYFFLPKVQKLYFFLFDKIYSLQVLISTLLIATELACPAYDISGPQEWVVWLIALVRLIRGSLFIPFFHWPGGGPLFAITGVFCEASIICLTIIHYFLQPCQTNWISFNNYDLPSQQPSAH